jgi:hypothetical protein
MSLRPWSSPLQRLASLFHRRPYSDRDIAGFLAELFECDLEHTDAEGLRFFVKHRIVTIHGTVYRAIDRDHVIRLASRIPGIEAIVDRIHVADAQSRDAAGAKVVLLLNGTYGPRHQLPA